MDIIIRRAKWDDLEAACVVEGAAIKGVQYLSLVAEEFINDPIGELSVAELDGKIVGVGKFTVLYDGAAWLETLRVDPNYQGRGIGKAFYNRFFEQAAHLGIKRMGMYTGFTNQVSKGLALRYGFEVSGQYRGANFMMTEQTAVDETVAADFRLLNEDEAEQQLAGMAEKWNGHMVMNRTFYPMNAGLYRGLAREDKVYYDEKGDNLIVLGARFIPQQALHIGLYKGDAKKCFEFAKIEARKRQVPKITIMFPPQATDVQEAVLEAGFSLEGGDCIVCEWHAK